jgi:hypothetical protein
MDVATGGHSSSGGLWWHGQGCIYWRVEGVVPAVGATEDVGQLHPIS